MEVAIDHTEKEEFYKKVLKEITRNKSSGKKIVWADFSISKEKKDIIVNSFSDDYFVTYTFCKSCSGYDVIVEIKI